MSRFAVGAPRSRTAHVRFAPPGDSNPCQSSCHAVELMFQVEGSSASTFVIPLPSITLGAEPFPFKLSPWWKALMSLGTTRSADAVWEPDIAIARVTGRNLKREDKGRIMWAFMAEQETRSLIAGVEGGGNRKERQKMATCGCLISFSPEGGTEC